MSYYGPDFPFTDDDLPDREPMRPHIEPTPQRPADLVVRPPLAGVNRTDIRPNRTADIPEAWHWLTGHKEVPDAETT